MQFVVLKMVEIALHERIVKYLEANGFLAIDHESRQRSPCFLNLLAPWMNWQVRRIEMGEQRSAT